MRGRFATLVVLTVACNLITGFAVAAAATPVPPSSDCGSLRAKLRAADEELAASESGFDAASAALDSARPAADAASKLHDDLDAEVARLRQTLDGPEAALNKAKDVIKLHDQIVSAQKATEDEISTLANYLLDGVPLSASDQETVDELESFYKSLDEYVEKYVPGAGYANPASRVFKLLKRARTPFYGVSTAIALLGFRLQRVDLRRQLRNIQPVYDASQSEIGQLQMNYNSALEPWQKAQEAEADQNVDLTAKLATLSNATSLRKNAQARLAAAQTADNEAFTEAKAACSQVNGPDLSPAGQWVDASGTILNISGSGGGPYSGEVVEGSSSEFCLPLNFNVSGSDGHYSGTSAFYDGNGPGGCGSPIGAGSTSFDISTDGLSATYTASPPGGGACRNCGPTSFSRKVDNSK